MNRQMIERKIQLVAKKIVHLFSPDKIILFGSWAWGKPHKDSDVDLLVVKKTKNTRTLAQKIDGSVFPRPFPMDLVVYQPGQLEKRKKWETFLSMIF